MKLRNKKTGEVVDGSIILKTDYHSRPWNCDSIAEIVEHWEDYKEPLIKDEKIRKAVRAWAEANEISQAQFDRYISGFSASDDEHNILSMISFDGFVFMFVDGKIYTIAELCGEEEE